MRLLRVRTQLHSPPEARISMGCGNPFPEANLKKSENVLCVGCGSTIDIFVCSNKILPDGKAVCLDAKSEMLSKIEEISKKYNISNIETQQGDLEKMPLLNNSFDVAICNCAFGAHLNKCQVLSEINRVLKPSGRLIISDILLKKPAPGFVKSELSNCINFAEILLNPQEYTEMLKKCGFSKTLIQDKNLDLEDLYCKDHKARKLLCGGKEACDFKEIKENLNDFISSCTIIAYK